MSSLRCRARLAKRPVLVWIHGGGYKAGSPSSPWYDGIAFNRDGVVTVSISYRLGFDGFGWIPDAPHNRGLLDQIEALRWVQRNISAFGGDPDRVTIAGQSAGGGSVWALMISPPAAVIPRRSAIRERCRRSPRRPAQDNGRAMADLAGVEWTRAGLSQVDEEKIIDLQDRVGPTTCPPISMPRWPASSRPAGCTWPTCPISTARCSRPPSRIHWPPVAPPTCR